MTTFMTRIVALSVVGVLATLLPASQAAAQTDNYPAKPITIVVGYPAGGSTDMAARILSTEFSKKVSASVVIENLGGAAGAIANQKVANAAPDGYTLLVGSNSDIAINRLVSSAVKYEIKDFTPIGVIASQPLVLVAAAKHQTFSRKYGSVLKCFAIHRQQISSHFVMTIFDALLRDRYELAYVGSCAS